MKLPPWLNYALVILISSVWAINFTAGIVIKTYHPPDSINLVFSSMITTLLLTRHRGDDDEDDSPKKGKHEEPELPLELKGQNIELQQQVDLNKTRHPGGEGV